MILKVGNETAFPLRQFWVVVHRGSRALTMLRKAYATSTRKRRCQLRVYFGFLLDDVPHYFYVLDTLFKYLRGNFKRGQNDKLSKS